MSVVLISQIALTFLKVKRMVNGNYHLGYIVTTLFFSRITTTVWRSRPVVLFIPIGRTKYLANFMRPICAFSRIRNNMLSLLSARWMKTTSSEQQACTSMSNTYLVYFSLGIVFPYTFNVKLAVLR